MTETRGPIVVKIGGAGVDSPRRSPDLWRAIARASAAAAGRLILVHGGGKAVDLHLERLGYTTQRVDGLRVTPECQIDEIIAVLAGRVNKGIVGAFHEANSSVGTCAVGLCLSDGRIADLRLITALSGLELGRVGEISLPSEPRRGLLDLLMHGGFVPILCSVGFSADGLGINVNADDAAAGIASIVGADRLVLLTDVDGVIGADARVIPELSGEEIDRLIEQGVIHGGMVPKVRAAARAARSAAAPATIASWNDPESIIRIARGEPAGTTILP